jgi:hypothetical protein
VFQGCLISHYENHHTGEHRTGSCFICSASLRAGFVPVDAEVQLHQGVPFYADSRGRDRYFIYRGTINVLPVAYLCLQHADLLQLPLRMAWPTTAGSITPEDVIEK